MHIRNYRPGDEAIQAAIYNEAAVALPKFKQATVDEVARRCQAKDFDPSTRFYAEENGTVIAYATFQANGRVSCPWTRRTHEHAGELLAEKVLEAMKARGIRKAFAAYRADWAEPIHFWERRGFHKARDINNYILQLSDMPTRAPRPAVVTLLRREDVPAIYAMAPEALRVANAAELEQHMFHNPYYTSADYYVLRHRDNPSPTAVGIVVQNPEYADPNKLDADMPCFRLGAFGTEGTTTKRINGLFSFLTANNSDALSHATQLLEYAAARLEHADMFTLAAQVPSDVPHLVRFYKHTFLRQGSFPIYEKEL